MIAGRRYVCLCFIEGSSLEPAKTSEWYAFNNASIAAVNRSDVLTATNPSASMFAMKARVLPLELGNVHSEDTMKYPDEALHSSHVDTSGSSRKDSCHTSLDLQSKSITSNDWARVPFTRSTSAAGEDAKRLLVDWARAILNRGGCSFK